EIGMNHAGEITPLARLVRPHVAIVTTVTAAHLEAFKDVSEIAEAKAEIFAGLEPDGIAILNRDNDQTDLLSDRAWAAGARIVFFGRDERADARLQKSVIGETCCCITASIAGQEVAYKIGAPGEHMVDNSLAVLATVAEVGTDLAIAALALAEFRAPKGRGERHMLKAGDGRIMLIDESYNANPASMRAAIAVLRDSAVEKPGRRIAVLGDMLELGERSDDLHRGLAAPLEDAAIDRVFLVGEHMKTLWEALPPALRGAYGKDSKELQPIVLREVHSGDTVMIKGSLGSRMGLLVEALTARYPTAPGTAGSV
ncbi:MAG: UDP-N-acetylmuramoylalanyl-D-glutamate--2,6-diaminopimelate ligase, partial [Hyphomicrobiales bacterium]|nr:UDP-N-acetylmuramoylalanyl-D-glutamate--2,6-diaminopimelate ligase [Hyphomicrobiales bacterium]